METATVTLQIPDILYQRLLQTAQATQQPLEKVVLHALQVGSPPPWDNIPEEFQADLASLDKLDDTALWEIARSHKSPTEMSRYDLLLEKNQNQTLNATERLELEQLRYESDVFMLRKAQAAALLRWRGHHVPLP